METLREIQNAHAKRDSRSYKSLDNWTLPEWGNALAGETGEACNIAKKIRRGDYDGDQEDLNTARRKLAMELADVVSYACLMASAIGWDLQYAHGVKFREVNERLKYVEENT